MEVQPPPPAPPSWSNLVKNLTEQPKLQAQEQHLNLFPSGAANQQSSGVLVGSCNSSKGIAVAVVDANAIIQGGERLAHSADRFVSVSDVIAEIRDPASRHSLNFLPFTVDTLEPSPDALKKVISFAKATGDLQTLSDVDLKLIALTYTLEAQIHGTQHLRDIPTPIHTVNVKRLPEKDLPGWGSNVPNLEDWEALEHLADNGPDPNSRILGVKDLGLHLGSADHNNKEDSLSLDGSESNNGNHKRYLPKKREVKIEGKKMVADGIDASQGEIDENAVEWLPAVSRSTHRKYLRRKARRETSEASSQLGDLGDQENKSSNVEKENLDDDQCPELLIDEKYEERISKLNKKINTEEVVSESLNNLKLEEESPVSFGDDTELILHSEEVELNDVKITENGKDIEITDQDSGHSVTTSQKNEYLDDLSSEQSWTLRSLSESSVACITGDFAIQNVVLQMGLRLLAPGGMQIRELHRWVLKCHACFKVTTDIGRIFCPACGNGGTLRKVAVTVSETCIVLASRKPHVSIRGTKFSLPLPQGGRDAVTKNPVLREDQLPHKYLYPKTKKKNNKGDEFIIADDIFRNHSEKKAPLQPPVRKAVAVFSGKRNPNDNHYARVKC